MTDENTRDALWAQTFGGEDDAHYWKVGGFVTIKKADGPGYAKWPITRITVQLDIPGHHCNLWRVVVWSGDQMMAEAPLSTLAAVGYMPVGEPS